MTSKLVCCKSLLIDSQQCTPLDHLQRLNDTGKRLGFLRRRMNPKQRNRLAFCWGFFFLSFPFNTHFLFLSPASTCLYSFFPSLSHPLTLSPNASRRWLCGAPAWYVLPLKITEPIAQNCDLQKGMRKGMSVIPPCRVALIWNGQSQHHRYSGEVKGGVGSDV